MLENATKHEWSRRPAIDDCMELVRQQLSILMEDFSKEREQKYILNEKMCFYRANAKPDSYVYDGSESIHVFLRDMIHQREISFSSGERTILLKPHAVRDRGHNFSCLRRNSLMEEFKDTLFTYRNWRLAIPGRKCTNLKEKRK